MDEPHTLMDAARLLERVCCFLILIGAARSARGRPSNTSLGRGGPAGTVRKKISQLRKQLAGRGAPHRSSAATAASLSCAASASASKDCSCHGHAALGCHGFATNMRVIQVAITG